MTRYVEGNASLTRLTQFNSSLDFVRLHQELNHTLAMFICRLALLLT